jgi:hypothetical protein
LADIALGPEPVGAWKPGGPALFAVAPRAEPSLLVLDAHALATGAGPVERLRLALDARPRVLAAGDLGADGRPEIALVTIADELILVRSGEIAQRQALSDTQATCALFGRDGRALLLGFQGTRRVVRYEPAPDGSLRETVACALDGLPRRLLELESPWPGAESARWVCAGGDASVWWLDDGLRIVRRDEVSTVPIDLDQRGAALLVTALHGQRATLLSSGAPAWSAYAGQFPARGELGDFDGDGRLDAAFAHGDAKRISILHGHPRFALPGLAPSGRAPQAVDAGDLDGDGHVDVVAVCGLDATLRAHRGGPAGLGPGAEQGRYEGAQRVRLADLDGDGRLDALLACVDARGARLELVFGDGTGGLWARAEVPPVALGRSFGDLVVRDLDGDGTFEALASDPDGGRLALVPIARVEGPGALAREPVLLELPGTPGGIALLDSRTAQGARFALALGAAPPRAGAAFVRAQRSGERWTLAEESHAALDQPARLAASGDFDGDGAPDLALVCGGEADGSLRVLLARGAGWTALPAEATGLRPHALAAGDLDGDGRSDLVLSAQNSHHLNLWLARPEAPGAPARLERRADLGVGTGPLDVLLCDLDGDGRLEIVAACSFSDELAVVRTR